MLAVRLARVSSSQVKLPGKWLAVPAGTAGASAAATAAASGRSFARCPMWLLQKSSSNRVFGSWARSAASGKRLTGLSGVRVTKKLQGNRSLSSFLPRRGGYSDSMVIYGIVGVSAFRETVADSFFQCCILSTCVHYCV